MFRLILCILIFASFENSWVFCHEGNTPASEERACVNVEEFVSFKSDILRELLQLKENGTKLENEMVHLKAENVEKERKIKELEQKVASLRKDQEPEHGMVRSRRQSFENIAFTAYLNHGVHNLTQDQPIIYNKVLLNDGGGYNTKTGMFTAPVSGVYLFSYSVGAKLLPNVHLSQYDVFTRLIVDGVHQLSAVAESTGTYDDEQGSTTAIVYVEEATTVWTKHEFRGGNNLYSDESERVTSFAGTLLYEKEPGIDSSIIG